MADEFFYGKHTKSRSTCTLTELTSNIVDFNQNRENWNPHVVSSEIMKIKLIKMFF